MGKFEIPIKMPTTQHSIRFPNELIDEVEEAIRGKETTFTAFVVAATRYEIEKQKENETKRHWFLWPFVIKI
mgnify:FL=1